MHEQVHGYGGYGGPPGSPPGGGYGPPGAPPGPPQGPPPGGYGGPPPGGYGAPPPGYGPPQPGYPAPGGPVPGGPAPKKSNPLLWIGLGCGALVVLVAIGGVLAWYASMRAAKAGLEQIASSGIPQVGAPGASGAAASSAGDCAKAAACCRAITSKTGANPQASAACDAVLQLNDAACSTYYRTYQQSARMLNVKCD